MTFKKLDMNEFNLDDLLAEIKITEKIQLRLTTELEEMVETLPQGSCIGDYWATGIGGRYCYHSLQNKNAVFPYRTPYRTEEGKLTKKLHLGTDINPNYRSAATYIEATRIKQIKEETLVHITKHKEALEEFYRALLADKERDEKTKRLMTEFSKTLQQESIFEFIKRQANTSQPLSLLPSENIVQTATIIEE